MTRTINGLSENFSNKNISKDFVWFIDIENLVFLTNMSRKFLEKEILSDPRMKLLERKKTHKRWWPAYESFKVINEITSEW